MFIEFQSDKEGKVISVNMDQIRIIEASCRYDGQTMLFWASDKDCTHIFESYESVMAKVRIRQ